MEWNGVDMYQYRVGWIGNDNTVCAIEAGCFQFELQLYNVELTQTLEGMIFLIFR